MKSQAIILTLFLSVVSMADAKVRMPHVFSDNMVLQADTTVALWGHATPAAEVRARGSWGKMTSVRADKDGVWRMSVATPRASFSPLSLTVTDTADSDSITFSNILAGEVWIASGQSNMEMPLRGFWNQPVEGGGEQIAFSRRLGKGIRFVTVPKAASYEPQYDFEGSWVECSPATVADFSAVGWYFSLALRDILDVPVGIISCAYGGSKVEGWEPAGLIANYPDRDMAAERLDTLMPDWQRVGVMYNAMLLPVAGYTARGFLWNQGESNVGGHDYYPSRQADMLSHWRSLWGNESMPFYFVELPGWEYDGVDATQAAFFREAQHKAAGETPYTYIVCTSDLIYPDEPDDIHARNKRPIGNRLAQSAATYTYGVEGVPHLYPTFREMDNKGDKAILTFDNAWNGFTPNDSPEGFEVAGPDRVFHRADAVIDRNRLTITVSSPEVDDIKSVRYCFKNFAIGRVHDTLGMPLIPFRTDNWDR